MDPQDLSQQLAVGLSKIGLALKHHSEQRSRPRGVSPLQAQILTVLTTRTGGMRLTALADELGVTRATASEAVTALGDKDLVLKGADPSDGRALHIRPTPAGRKLAQRVTDWPDLVRDIVSGLGEEEQGVFLRVLLEIVRGLQRRGEIPLARMCLTCRYFEPWKHTLGPAPHHCAFVDEPLRDADLRAECPDHEPIAVP